MVDVLSRLDNIQAYAQLTGDPRLAEAARIVLEAAQNNKIVDLFTKDGTKITPTLAKKVNELAGQYLTDDITLRQLYPWWKNTISEIPVWRDMMATMSAGERGIINSTISIARDQIHWLRPNRGGAALTNASVGEIRELGVNGLMNIHRLGGHRGIFLAIAFKS